VEATREYCASLGALRAEATKAREAKRRVPSRADDIRRADSDHYAAKLAKIKKQVGSLVFGVLRRLAFDADCWTNGDTRGSNVIRSKGRTLRTRGDGSGSPNTVREPRLGMSPRRENTRHRGTRKRTSSQAPACFFHTYAMLGGASTRGAQVQAAKRPQAPLTLSKDCRERGEEPRGLGSLRHREHVRDSDLVSEPIVFVSMSSIRNGRSNITGTVGVGCRLSASASATDLIETKMTATMI